MLSFFPCVSTYHTVVPACFTEGIRVDIGLPASSTFRYVLTTPYNKVYAGEVTTDAQGEAVMMFEDVPPELLNPWIQLFQLAFYVITDGVPNCNPQTFTICDVVYNNIALKFIEATGLPAVIGCQCEEV